MDSSPKVHTYVLVHGQHTLEPKFRTSTEPAVSSFQKFDLAVVPTLTGGTLANNGAPERQAAGADDAKPHRCQGNPRQKADAIICPRSWSVDAREARLSCEPESDNTTLE